MLHQVRANRRNQRKSQSKTRQYQSLQKPNGVISPRVQKVGGERFAIVCVDPAKHRKRWTTAGRSLTKAAALEGLRFHDLRHTATNEPA